MAELSEYERLRLKNIEENRRMLCQLGLLSEDWKPPKPKPHSQIFVKIPTVKKKKKIENGDPLFLPGRRSLRPSLSNDTDDSDFTDSINGEYSGSESGKEKLPKRPNSYGAIEGVEIGEIWETRIECSRAGIHRPTVAGIHPGREGAYSIALSGGYEDNYDGGESFTYTGAGGRDLKGTKIKPKNLRTGPQVKDQTLDGVNGSLATSVKTRNPVRVIRGYKSNSPFAPEVGYRYDGLYQVEKYWTAEGVSGHLVYKFALKRCSDQNPPPWVINDDDSISSNKETDVKTSSGLDDTSDNVMNPFVQMGKKLTIRELPAEVDAPGHNINGKMHSPEKFSSEHHSNLNVNNIEVTPEKSVVGNKTFDLNKVSKSPKRVNSKTTPAKNKSSPVADENVYKSPVKMIASNQSIDDSSVSLEEVDVDSSLNNPHPSNNNTNSTENGNYIENNTLPDIFDDSSPSYLKSRRRSHEYNYSSGRSKGKKRSPSPDDFGKICDELCNELPKIEKVKRLRFSFEHFTDNDLQLIAGKTRRKRSSRTPRKSSLIVTKDTKSTDDNCEQNLIFSKYIEVLLVKFPFADEDDYLGWDDYCDEFEGWTDEDVTEAKRYTSSFSDFVFKCGENNSFSSTDENGWAGWEDVSRRSLILNGFLLEEISRNRKSCDSDGTDAPGEFLGFQEIDEKSMD